MPASDHVSEPLAGQVAVVTGGASGIGAATVRLLAQAGAQVAVLDRNPAPPEAAGFVRIDLADTGAIPGAVEEVLRRHGRIDILVNAAGVTGRPEPTDLLGTSEGLWERVFRINATAPFRLIQCVAGHMVQRGGGGRIVNVTSAAAHRALAATAYSSSKAALTQLSRAAAGELAPYGVNVNSVAPGATRTPFTDNDDEAMERAVAEGPAANLFKRLAEPEDVAATIVFLCLPESRQITAQTIHTSAGSVL